MVSTVGGLSGLSSALLNSTSGDTRVSEGDKKKSDTELWREKAFSSSSGYLHNKHEHTLFCVQLLMLAARSSQCPQTP